MSLIVEYAEFEYAEFNDAVHFFRFWLETPFLGKFGLNLVQYLQFFFVSDQKCLLWANLVQNVKIVSLRLNLVASIGILKSHTHQQEYHQPSVDDTC